MYWFGPVQHLLGNLAISEIDLANCPVTAAAKSTCTSPPCAMMDRHTSSRGRPIWLDAVSTCCNALPMSSCGGPAEHTGRGVSLTQTRIIALRSSFCATQHLHANLYSRPCLIRQPTPMAVDISVHAFEGYTNPRPGNSRCYCNGQAAGNTNKRACGADDDRGVLQRLCVALQQPRHGGLQLRPMHLQYT